ncbi:MAG TPA: DUF1634 domain-containing protein [Pirellulales bacterium]|nr:DUF1634 domain-containing protein [Pirellulales bacterium]
MPDDDSHWLQHWVHWTLLAGLAASAVLLTCGLAFMVGQGHEHAARHETLGMLCREAARFNGPAITTLGLLVLMITPIMRVIVLLLGWALRRDWLFAAVAFVVLGLLVLSLSLGVG